MFCIFIENIEGKNRILFKDKGWVLSEHKAYFSLRMIPMYETSFQEDKLIKGNYSKWT